MRGIRWIGVGLLLAVVVTSAVTWWQKDRLQAWYALRGLSQADETSRPVWIERVVALGDSVVEPLLDSLATEGIAGENALAALGHLARAHGIENAGCSDLTSRLARRFGNLTPVRQASVLEEMAGWFSDQKPAEGLMLSAAKLLTESASSSEEAVQGAALDLAAVLVRQKGGEFTMPAAREMARTGLRSPASVVRLRAIKLCLQPGIEQLDQVVGLLRDPSPEVRRAAVVAVGPADQVAREESLLPGLHDEDAEVRKLTEAALRGRGLRPEQLELGRLLTHPQSLTRMQVVDHLREVLDNLQGGNDLEIDPGLWLRRLSHDSSPAVRAAALRLMSQQSAIDLSDRMDQMARNDPSPTVCQLARFYLEGRRPPER